jgi:hypothetical protein
VRNFLLPLIDLLSRRKKWGIWFKAVSGNLVVNVCHCFSFLLQIFMCLKKENIPGGNAMYGFLKCCREKKPEEKTATLTQKYKNILTPKIDFNVAFQESVHFNAETCDNKIKYDLF